MAVRLNRIPQIVMGRDTAFNGIPETYVAVGVWLLGELKEAQTSTADYSLRPPNFSMLLTEERLQHFSV